MKLSCLALVALLFAAPVLGQGGSQPAVTGSGNLNTIPVFTGSSTISTSLLSQSSSGVYVNGYVIATAPTLGTNNGDTTTLLNLGNSNGNANGLFFTQYRNTTTDPADYNNWFTATTRIANWTDSSAQGYIDFNPTTVNYPQASGALAFGYANNEFMRINGGGYVGIGTTVPQNMFSLVGGINVDQNDTDDGTNTFTTYQSNLGISFGDSSGEGISSARPNGAPNQYGLDFYTAFQKRLSITSTGNVGIGTVTPGSSLEVNGSITLSSGSNGGIVFPNGQTQTVPYIPSTATTPVTGVWTGAPLTAAYLPSDVMYTDVSQTVTGQNTFAGPTYFGANVGIGTSSPERKLDVFGTISAATVAGNTGDSGWFMEGRTGADEAANNSNAVGLGISVDNATANALSLTFGVNPAWPTEHITERMRITSTGNVGIGTTTPGADLTSISSPPSSSTPIFEVNGDIALTQNSAAQNTGGSVIFSDGTVQSTAWNGTTFGGDYAESIDVLGDRAAYEPGDVIVIDESTDGKFEKSAKSYSRMVAGVYSTKPGLVGRRTTADRPNKQAEVPMAMMGIVPTKVTTENGPIERGDLLVSSSTLGYAMKGTDRDRLTGAVLGKALAPLTSGSGVIEVLLALQ